jgi:hypothetical protein
MTNLVTDYKPFGFERLAEQIVIRAANDLRIQRLGVVDRISALAFFLDGGGAARLLRVMGFEDRDRFSKVAGYAMKHGKKGAVLEALEAGMDGLDGEQLRVFEDYLEESLIHSIIAAGLIARLNPEGEKDD